MHVIQQRIVSDGMYKPGVVVPVCTIIGVSYIERSWKAKESWKGSASNMEVGALRGQGWPIPEKDKLSKSMWVSFFKMGGVTLLVHFYLARRPIPNPILTI